MKKQRNKERKIKLKQIKKEKKRQDNRKVKL